MPDIDGTHLDDRDFLLAERLRDGASVERVAREFALAPATVLVYASRIRALGVQLPSLERGGPQGGGADEPAQRSPGFSIQTTAKLCGIAASNLRIWELRYGWPEPTRLRNRYRVYSPDLVMQLRRMKKLLDDGHRIGDLILEGEVVWPDEPKGPIAKPPSRETRSLDKLERPTDRRWAMTFDQVMQALQRRAYGQLQELLERAALDLRSDGIVTGLLLPMVYGLCEQHHEVDVLPGQVTTLLHRSADILHRLIRRLPVGERSVGQVTYEGCPEAVIALTAYACRGLGYELVEDESGPLRLQVGAGVGRGGPFGIWIAPRLPLASLYRGDASVIAELLGEESDETASQTA